MWKRLALALAVIVLGGGNAQAVEPDMAIRFDDSTLTPDLRIKVTGDGTIADQRWYLASCEVDGLKVKRVQLVDGASYYDLVVKLVRSPMLADKRVCVLD